MLRAICTKRFVFAGVSLATIFMLSMIFVYPGHAGSQARGTASTGARASTQPQSLTEMIAYHKLASTVQILSSQPPSVIVQFPLFPSGIAKAFPQATGVVTIVQGNPDDSLADSVTVDVSHMPPGITFTIFFIEHATKPFGFVEYVSDLETLSDGTGESTFQAISLQAFAMNSDTPGTSQDQSGAASGTQLEHLGMWFSSLQDAQTVLKNTALTGTPFDGGNPPLHAGPQAMTDGQTSPVF